MTQNISIKKTNLFYKYYPFILLLLIPGGLVSSMIMGDITLFVLGAAIVVPPVIVSFYYLRKHEIFRPNLNKDSSLFTNKLTVLFKLYLVFYLLSIASLIIFPHRMLNYFVLISIIYLLVFISAMHNNSSKYVVGATFLNTLNLSWGIMLNYPLHFAGSDILLHRVWSKIIVDHGFIVSSDVTSYAYFPLYHIFMAQSSQVLYIDVDTATYIIAGIVFSISILMVYLVSRATIGINDTTTLSPVLFSIYPTVVYYNSYVITRVFAFIGFLFILYLFIRSEFNRKSHILLYMLFVAYIILVHNVSNIQILFIIFLLYVLVNLCEVDKKPKISIITAYSVTFLIYLIFVSDPFFEKLLFEYILFIDGGASSIPTIGDRSFQPLPQYINNYIIIFTILVGLGIGIKNHKNLTNKSLPIFVLMALFAMVYLPNPLQITDLFWNTLRFDRFILLVSPFVSIIMSIGIISVVKNYGINVASIIIILLVFTSITAVAPYPVAPDSEDIGWTGPPQHFDKQELSSFEHTKSYSEGVISSDESTQRYFRPYQLAGIYDISPVELEAGGPNQGDIVLRTHRLNTGGLTITNNNIKMNYDSIEDINIDINNRNNHYANGNVDIYSKYIEREVLLAGNDRTLDKFITGYD